MSRTAKGIRRGSGQTVQTPKAVIGELAVEPQTDTGMLRPTQPAKFSEKFLRSVGAWADFERHPQGREPRRRIFP